MVNPERPDLCDLRLGRSLSCEARRLLWLDDLAEEGEPPYSACDRLRLARRPVEAEGLTSS